MQRLDRAASARFRNPRFPASLALPSLTATLVCLFAYGLAPLAPARAAKDDAGGVVVGLPPPPPPQAYAYGETPFTCYTAYHDMRPNSRRRKRSRQNGDGG